ncbi:hypothetical protein [Chryseobacterium sp.]|uniref:hypothetical protein n=1 Tax=Chryseobacterium sp. TaxID=1871047 RepID=UPI0028A26707|nr:hypothetical protein [Chryseobacterium sp.]
MKQLQLDLKKRLLIVEFPNNECEFGGLLNKRNLYFFTDKMTSDDYPACFPLQNDCEFICKGSELTEKIADDLVHGIKDKTALESFISAIEANGYYWGENPIPRPIEDRTHHAKWQIKAFKQKLKNYKESESKTFNPEKTLIFEIA